MSLGIKDALGRGARERIVIGIDLAETYSQLSFAAAGERPQTLRAAAGDERLCIPTALAKRYGENAWVYGTEALALYEAQDGTLINGLLARARSGRAVSVEGTDYDPTDLLALFLRKCLSRLLSVAPLEKVAAIVISVEQPDERMIAVLADAVRILRLKKERVFFQSHAESAFYYIRQQPSDLTAQEVLVCDLTEEGMHGMLYRKNFHTRPQVMLLTEKRFPSFLPERFLGGGEEKIRREHKDQDFKTLLYSMIEGHLVSATYLLGDGFDGEWYGESLKYICKNSRVFRGNNLYSQGACYSALERAGLMEEEETKALIFLGEDKLKANLGIQLIRGGETAYLALVDAGKNWYDCTKECELIADDTDRLELLVTPLDGKEASTVTVWLNGLPARGKKATRLHLELKMLSEKKARLVVTDLGFGEFYPPSGLAWEHTFYV